MADARRTLYSSANGDQWFLVRDTATGEPFVLHQPNRASGGDKRQIAIGTFLARGEKGPEHQELLRLIGTLADGD